VECPNERLRTVIAHTYVHREHADEALAEYLRPEAIPTVRISFDGQPFSVRVPVSERVSPFGRTLQRSQFQFLVVIVELHDGRRLGQVVDIPDGRVSTELWLKL
ncbi:MAG: hypothetical protein ACRCZF_02000, partial [Gemmataceae bacterium]